MPKTIVISLLSLNNGHHSSQENDGFILFHCLLLPSPSLRPVTLLKKKTSKLCSSGSILEGWEINPDEKFTAIPTVLCEIHIAFL